MSVIATKPGSWKEYSGGVYIRRVAYRKDSRNLVGTALLENNSYFWYLTPNSEAGTKAVAIPDAVQSDAAAASAAADHLLEVWGYTLH